MNDIYTLEHEVHSKLNLFVKEIFLMNKSLRKKFPKDKSFMNERHELKKLVGDVKDALFRLECIALKENTAYSMKDLWEEV